MKPADAAPAKAKGVKELSGGDIEAPGQAEILNPELHIALAHREVSGARYRAHGRDGPRLRFRGDHPEAHRVDIGSITLDAAFTPIRKANYEVENMRVGDRTDFNRLRLSIETDGTIAPREALEKSITLMIHQLKSVVGFIEEEPSDEDKKQEAGGKEEGEAEGGVPLKEIDSELLKTRVDALELSSRTVKALTNGNVRTLGGLARKKESDIMDIDGLGAKGMQEIKKLLAQYGITLKQ